MIEPGVELWALNEVHFQQHGSRCRMWVPPEVKDPVLLHHPIRKSVGYFGAVRLDDGRFSYRQERGKFNGESFWTLMKLLASKRRRGRRMVVIADNAKYHPGVLHKDWRESRANTFALEFLPPYSPDLNPIERLWKLTRRLCLHNRYFPALDEVVEAVEPTFDSWS